MPEMLLKTDSHSLKLKAYFVTDSATEFFIDTYRKPLGFTIKRLRHSFMLKPNSVTYSFTAIYRKDLKL